jgi:PKD repeat protein
MNRHLYFLLAVVATASLCTAGFGAEQPAVKSVAAPASTGDGRVAVLITFRNVPGPSEQALVRGQGGPIKYSYRLVPGIAASLPKRAVASLLAHPSVVRIDPDGEIHALDAELDASWGVKRIGAGTIHDGLNKGSGVKVAIIDTGIDYHHPDLALNYKGGHDFVNDDTEPLDDHSHGTHVAGIVAARDNGTGVVGVAPEASLYALKILNASGSGNDSDLIAAVEWAIEHSMQVINLSLGTSAEPGPLVQAAFDAAEEAGIVTVAAAGNSDIFGLLGNTVEWPARYESVIAVGATDSANSLAYYSSTGPQLELAAPGNSIYSTVLNGAYGTKSGTSMAAPHVAGAAALVIAAGYGDVRARLIGTADDLGLSGRDTWYGYGLVDADEAAAPTGEPPAAPTANFTATPTSGDAPLIVQFTDESLGTVDSCSWNFGDGRTSAEQNPSHTYAAAGTYTVSLIVTGPGGSDDETKIDYISVSTPPVANFTGSPLIGPAPLIVSFTDLSTGDVTAWSWDFGDTGGSSLQHPSHEYSNAGIYTVTLTVTGSGSTDVAVREDYVVVEDPTPEPPPALTTMHVDSITVYAEKVDKASRGKAQVVILDNDNYVVPHATVTGRFSGSINETVTATTGDNGLAEFSTVGTKRGRCRLTFCVDDVTGAGLTYTPGDNIETCDQNY